MSRNCLRAGQFLTKGESLVSKNGNYKVVFQEDGNFVVYTWKPIWATNTAGIQNVEKQCMQEDNNLVIYTSSGTSIWASGSYNPVPSKCILIMQDDGNLVIYRDESSVAPSNAVWHTDTAGK